MFDTAFEVNVALPLAKAAYDAANDVPLKLPDGYTKIADVVVNSGRLAARMARATPAEHKLVQSMLLEARKPEIFGIIAQKSEIAAVSFRGTLTPGDWLKDLDFEHVPFQAVPEFGNVHQGFQLVYEAIEQSVKEGLSACSGRTRTIIIGHSLGGALSVLCAPDLAINARAGKAAPEVHTFAGPRVAAPDIANPINSTFAERFNETVPVCFRVTNHWDVVPNLPPPVLHYVHVGTGVGVDAGFTCDLIKAHSLGLSYEPALRELLLQPFVGFHAARVA